MPFFFHMADMMMWRCRRYAHLFDEPTASDRLLLAWLQSNERRKSGHTALAMSEDGLFAI